MKKSAYKREDVRDPDYLKSIFFLDEKGRLSRTVSRFNSESTIRVGNLGKASDGSEAVVTYVDTIKLRVDAIIIAITQGAFPDDVRHIDGDIMNMAVENLEPVFAKKKHRGVHFRVGKWTAEYWCREMKKTQYIGRYESETEAVEARKKFIEGLA